MQFEHTRMAGVARGQLQALLLTCGQHLRRTLLSIWFHRPTGRGIGGSLSLYQLSRGEETSIVATTGDSVNNMAIEVRELSLQINAEVSFLWGIEQVSPQGIPWL